MDLSSSLQISLWYYTVDVVETKKKTRTLLYLNTKMYSFCSC